MYRSINEAKCWNREKEEKKTNEWKHRFQFRRHLSRFWTTAKFTLIDAICPTREIQQQQQHWQIEKMKLKKSLEHVDGWMTFCFGFVFEQLLVSYSFLCHFGALTHNTHNYNGIFFTSLFDDDDDDTHIQHNKYMCWTILRSAFTFDVVGVWHTDTNQSIVAIYHAISKLPYHRTIFCVQNKKTMLWRKIKYYNNLSPSNLPGDTVFSRTCTNWVIVAGDSLTHHTRKNCTSEL